MSSIANSILHLHGWVALVIVFGLPLLESSMLVGFIFPGETAAILAGVLAYEHRLALLPGMVAVVLGAIIGDTIGYEVGRHAGTRLLHGPLSRWIKPHHVERAEEVLRRYGSWAVFLGRFTAALRVMVPALAGTGRMPYRRFAVANMTGGLLWGVAFVLVGYAAGASWRAVAHTAGTAGLIAAGVVAVGIAGVLVWRRRRSRVPAEQQHAGHPEQHQHDDT